jgi:hypothetical protein
VFAQQIKETLKMTSHQLSIACENAGLWRVTFNNPPINMFVPTTIVELGALMTDRRKRCFTVYKVARHEPDYSVKPCG